MRLGSRLCLSTTYCRCQTSGRETGSRGAVVCEGVAEGSDKDLPSERPAACTPSQSAAGRLDAHRVCLAPTVLLLPQLHPQPLGLTGTLAPPRPSNPRSPRATRNQMTLRYICDRYVYELRLCLCLTTRSLRSPESRHVSARPTYLDGPNPGSRLPTWVHQRRQRTQGKYARIDPLTSVDPVSTRRCPMYRTHAVSPRLRAQNNISTHLKTNMRAAGQYDDAYESTR